MTAALIVESPDAVTDVITAIAARLRNPPRTSPDVVAALNKTLPAIAALNPPK